MIIIFFKKIKTHSKQEKKINIPALQAKQKIEFLTKKYWYCEELNYSYCWICTFQTYFTYFWRTFIELYFLQEAEKERQKEKQRQLAWEAEHKKTPVVCLNRQKTPYINNQWEQILQWSFGKSSWERKIDEWILQQNELRVSIFWYYDLPLCIIFIAWILFPLTYFVE